MRYTFLAVSAVGMTLSMNAAYAAPSFGSYDQNSDGIITIDEYDTFILAPFDRIDTNNDLKISPEEAIVVARTRAQGTRKKPRQMVRRLFERFDSNADQFLTALELGYGGAGEFFNLHDANANGEVSLAEWGGESSANTADTSDSEPDSNTSASEEPTTSSSPTERAPAQRGTSDNEVVYPDKDVSGRRIGEATRLTGDWLFNTRP